MLADDDERVVALVDAVHAGDLDRLRALLAEHPSLATERLGDDAMSRTALHLVADWPGHWPNGAEVVRVLVDAGAPVDGRFAGPHGETPLHWAASSDDVEVLDALLDAGADIEADGAVLTGGTPLSDAVVFAQWAAARRLVERGAVMTLWQAAALGETRRSRRCSRGSAYGQSGPRQRVLARVPRGAAGDAPGAGASRGGPGVDGVRGADDSGRRSRVGRLGPRGVVRGPLSPPLPLTDGQ